MRRILTSAVGAMALAASGLSLQGSAYAQTRELATKGELLDRVAAIVNDGVVLNSELDAQIETVAARLRAQKLELPPQNILRQQVLERLVLQEIQLQHATRAGVKVPDETLNAALLDIAKRNNLTLSQLPQALAEQGIDYPSYRDEMRKEITLTLLRQRDVLQHIALAQQRQGDLLAHLVAVRGVVDALLGKRLRQLRQRQVIALGDVQQRRVEGLVRDLHPRAGGMLQLDFLQHEALEYLLAQDVLRRQFELLRAQPRGDGFDLRVELTVEHHAVVDDRRDPVEQFALGG